MRKILFFLPALIVMLSFVSCRTSEELVFLKDMEDHEIQEGLPVAIPDYRIQVNDNLYVNIQSMNPEANLIFNPNQGNGYQAGTYQMYGQASSQYLNGFQVNKDGNITLPVIGAVKVEGLKVAEAREHIQERVDGFLKESTVKVKLLSYKVTVLGEVKVPGTYYNYSNNITVLEAISMANGVTDFASIGRVLVMRPTEKGTESFRINMTSKEMLSSEAFFLLPNDVVYVEPDKYKNVKLNSTTYSLFLSSLTILLAILAIVR
jgi:polysaccharide export outer membrane protein